MNIIEKFIDICKNRDIKGAIELQKSLQSTPCVQSLHTDFQTICAFDISYDKSSQLNFAVAVIMNFSHLELVETQNIIEKSVFPYISGLLAFREGPSIIRLYRKLKTRPDLLLFDGQGNAHPRGTGIASVIGFLLDIPSIGCAKTRLVGEYIEPGLQKGNHSDLNFRGQIVGRVLRTRKGVKPVFVSPGHKIDLNTTTDIVLRCCRKFRLPEPIREAHKLANEIMKNCKKNE